MGTCRECGCTDERACVSPEGEETCFWAEPDLCSFCALGKPRAAPDEDDLGPCCGCGEPITAGYKNLVMLDYLSPTPGRGWGCAVCGIPSIGAVAVLCDTCLASMQAGLEVIRWVMSGEDSRERTPLAECARPAGGELEHDMAAHEVFEGVAP